MNKYSVLIMHLIAVSSVGSKTKHTYTVQKSKATFTAVNIGIGIQRRNFLV